MVRITVLIVCLLFSIGTIHAQLLKKQTLVSAGSSHFVNANNKSYFIQESIGQHSVINTFDANNYSLRQGFLQPISPNVLNGSDDTVLDGFLYPNPFVDEIHIRFNEPIISEIQLYMYDALGRVVYQQTFQAQQEINLRFSALADGNYFITATMRNQKFVAKLIKI